MGATFRYFAEPHRFSTWTAEPAPCGVCGTKGPGYRGPFRGKSAPAFVCEACLAGGKLAPLAVKTNEGDRTALEAQLENARVTSPVDVARLANERTLELEHRTPSPVTWQPLTWPVHCGDYARYLKEIGKADLQKLAPEGKGRAFLAARLIGDSIEATIDEEEIDNLWGGLREDSPADNSKRHPMTVSLFECLKCRSAVILWDCD